MGRFKSLTTAFSLACDNGCGAFDVSGTNSSNKRMMVNHCYCNKFTTVCKWLCYKNTRAMISANGKCVYTIFSCFSHIIGIPKGSNCFFLFVKFRKPPTQTLLKTSIDRLVRFRRKLLIQMRLYFLLGVNFLLYRTTITACIDEFLIQNSVSSLRCVAICLQNSQLVHLTKFSPIDCIAIMM